ncbi:MAG: hypothetical protein ACR2OZ_10705 [Verrucomicrobiales bacterium]
MKWIVSSVMAVLGSVSLLAHPDPAHNIEQITAQIAAGDRRPPLFYSRGVEHRALGQLKEAERDFRECVNLDPAFVPARKDLASVLADQGRTNEALVFAQEAIRHAGAKSPPVQASCWSLLARIELARKDFKACIEATSEAFKLVPRGELDWFLLRAEAQQGLGCAEGAIADLKSGYDTLKSSVLRTAWLDALVEAGRGAEALPMIEAEMAECRYRASWLIRRARIRVAQKQTAAAKGDLHAALAELELHIFPDEPDPTLLVERGMVFALLGETKKAREELERVRSITSEADVGAPLEKLLAAQ